MAIEQLPLLNSTFTRLNDVLLVEYTYGSKVPPAEIPAEIGSSQSDGNFLRFRNNYAGFDGTYQICNTENTLTNNTQRHQTIPVSRTRFANNTNTDPIPYYFTDENIEVDFLGLQLPNTIDVIYDRVRLHFAQGWSFSDVEGIILYVQAQEKSRNYTTLASVKHLSSDNWFEFNPRPIQYGETLFDTYIEILVPSVQELQFQYEVTPPAARDDTFAYRFTTDTMGFNETRPIIVGVFEIDRTITDNGFQFFDVGQNFEAQFNQADEFQNIYAEIRESENGDFFEYQLKEGSNSIEDFIFAQNARSDTNYTLTHRLVVREQVGGSEIETDIIIRPQNGNFDQVLRFRPVLSYADTSPAFSIDYEATLVNRLGGRSINRRASTTCVDCKKYGRRLESIPVNPVAPLTVYNKVVDGQKFDITNNFEMPIVTKFVPTFIERDLITTSAQTLLINQNGEVVNNQSQSSTDLQSLQGQGQARITLTPFDNPIQFKIYRSSQGQALPLNLNFNSTFFLVFFSDTNQKTYVQNNTTSTLGNTGEGQLAFFVDKETAEKVLTFSNRKFNIISRDNQTGNETSLYSGEWVTETEAAGSETQTSQEQQTTGATNTTQSTNGTNSTTSTTTQAVAGETDAETLRNAKAASNERQRNRTSPQDVVDTQTANEKQSRPEQTRKVLGDTGVVNMTDELDRENEQSLVQLQVPDVSVSNTAKVKGISVRKRFQRRVQQNNTNG